MKDRTLLTQTADQMLLAGMSLQDGAVEIQKEMIARSLLQNRGNMCRVARDLRLHRNTLSRKVHDYGIAEVVRECRAGARIQPTLPLRKSASRKSASKDETVKAA